ncbi:MAG: cysteine--tRNA ligase [Deltaproteobacteria bacterium]|nr:cysteine--tRNA ligase [Deltaproteobacteria bacterium]
MEIKFFNSLSRKKETFEPIKPGEVKIYICGVTVYDRCHLGHARGAVNFDVLRNLLKALGLKVTYVKNYTDIDDKIINRAREKGIDPKELTEQMILYHDQDMESLGISPPDFAPKATTHIPEIIGMIEKLIERGYAYQAPEGVFFKVRQFGSYGKLSGKQIDDLIAGARVAVMDQKQDALDFALWKTAKEGEPSWESPWGQGRPGWHIECSAMSRKYLGQPFDIHAGGSDLIFPHHENEIAQSECCFELPFANYWLHNGMIQIDQQKMSKSLGNFALIKDLVEIYHPEVLRFFIISTQYRHSLHFNHEAITSSAEGLDRIYRALFNDGQSPEKAGDTHRTDELETDRIKFYEYLRDDINTPQAIGVLFELTKKLNSARNDPDFSKAVRDCLLELGAVLGILRSDPKKWFLTPRIKNEEQGLVEDEIEALIFKRKTARELKDWSRADQIRDQLLDAGILIEDKDNRTYWKRK